MLVRNDSNSYAYHDMDDDGVPDGANERWRQDRVVPRCGQNMTA